MKLYHASKNKFEHLERRQANKGNTEVPADEVLNAIYFTPDYGRAIAMGSCPEGENTIDEKNNTITFENPKLFNPDEDIYVYCVDSETISADKIKLGENGLDYVVSEEKVTPSDIKKIKAREVFNFFKVLNWEGNKEMSRSLKLR